MKVPLIVAAAAALTFAALPSQAAVISGTYTSIGINTWRADLTVTNDANIARFAGFSVDFPSATNLQLVSSPAAWDSMVFQPDANLSDPGYLDSFLRNVTATLAPGQSVGGFGVSFNYAGGMPGALPFLVYDTSFNVLAAGNATIAAIPEPATALLAALGLAFIGLRSGRAYVRKTHATNKEVTA
ncbi:PEP-CTERM sorting domain-containing protein [Piscinibacter koreensis]|uniref:PEP-CTERM sorting domain-containing protein n=1 Tax=Piscinibacter koreensis TaxID=2742824 RepID=A0A7Y6TZI0_9BURK|nr:PEP-CTERM sorting domain-containing protein [Schlegelella koreensis]NUZ09141.1 PEP-CTERM sorting domain-containing protein [Schlegelella koreensis]